MTSAPAGAVDLLPLTRELREAVLTFEEVNRLHFAQTVSDRGDAYFTDFDLRFEALLAEQADGRSVFTVLLDDDAAVLPDGHDHGRPGGGLSRG